MSCGGGGGGNGNGREHRELGKSAMNTPLNCYLFKFLTVVHVVAELTLLTGNFTQRSAHIEDMEGINISYTYVDH